MVQPTTLGAAPRTRREARERRAAESEPISRPVSPPVDVPSFPLQKPLPEGELRLSATVLPASRRDRRRAEHGLPLRPRVAFRPDVEGLRAVAVVLVVAFHARLGPLPGGFVGVDVFFVISGFLITSLLVDEVRATGTIRLTDFYARRARRILPAACLVLVVTAIAGAVVLPGVDRPQLATDVRSAAFFVANWHFAALSTDYFAAPDSSFVLHYWSLSLEEQFYLLWPVLVLVVAGRRRAARRARRPGPRDTDRRLWAALAPIVLVSLALSAATTAAAGPWAYFGTQTRAWELGVGAAVVLSRPYLYRLTETQAAVGGWIGLSAVLGSALLLGDRSLVPGVVLLLPVAGAAALVAAGARTQLGAAALLGSGPLAALGRLSFSWYLWHWPCLELVRRVWGGPAQDDVPPPDVPAALRLAAVLASLGLAVLTFRFVEEPTRNARWARPAVRRSLPAAAVLAAGTVLLAAAALSDHEPAVAWAAPASAAMAAPSPTVPGRPTTPVSRASRPVVPPETLTMTPAQARADIAPTRDCFAGFGPASAPPDCRFGDPKGTKVVVLFGDSHAHAWFPALAAAARRNQWQLWFWAKSGCGYADVRQFLASFHREYTECTDWRRSVLARIHALPQVDLVVVGRSISYLSELLDSDGTQVHREAAVSLWSRGADRTLATLVADGRRVALLRDVPRPGFDVPGCVFRHAKQLTACSFPRTSHVLPDRAVFDAEKSALAARGAAVVDLTSAICPGDPCRTVDHAGAILYRDGHHLTATYARELTGPLGQALARLLF
jgi:peptidoglycan/LPS O-acetylase OafA/YrhL